MNNYRVVVFAAHRLAPPVRGRGCGLPASAAKP
jgi:hypothetical protein